jgi:hypothetical protein
MLLGRSSHQNVRLRETSQILVGPDLPTKISLQSRDSWTHWNLEPPARYKSYIAAPVNRACTWPAKTVSSFERLKMRKHEDATQGRTKHQINTCLNICSIMLHMPQGLTFNSPYNHRVQSTLQEKGWNSENHKDSFWKIWTCFQHGMLGPHLQKPCWDQQRQRSG